MRKLLFLSLIFAVFSFTAKAEFTPPDTDVGTEQVSKTDYSAPAADFYVADYEFANVNHQEHLVIYTPISYSNAYVITTNSKQKYRYRDQKAKEISNKELRKNRTKPLNTAAGYFKPPLLC